MQAPSPSWKVDYRHDRRAHRHRCQCCSKILAEGDAVIMAKVDSKTTRAVHAACADRPFSGGWTFADALDAWGIEYLRACGYKRLAPHPMSSDRG